MLVMANRRISALRDFCAAFTCAVTTTAFAWLACCLLVLVVSRCLSIH